MFTDWPDDEIDSTEDEGNGDDAALIVSSSVIKSLSQTGYGIANDLAELQSMFMHIAGPDVDFDLHDSDNAFESGFKILLVATPAYVDNASMEYYMAEYPVDDGNGLQYFDMTVKLQTLEEARLTDDEGNLDGMPPKYLTKPMHSLLLFAIDDDYTLRELKLARPDQDQAEAIAMQPFPDAFKLDPPQLDGKWVPMLAERRRQFH